MNRFPLIIALLVVLGLSACQTAPKQDLDLERVKTQLEQLQEDDELAGYAPLALGEAERAIRQAEMAKGDVQREHLVFMAEKRIEIARAMAQREQHEKNHDELEVERNEMLLKASKMETERARKETEQARLLLAATTEDAERQRQEKEQALQQGAETARAAELAQEEADQARRLAKSRASEAELAKREAELAVAQMDTLKRQLENLQLRKTESGVVVTLGDVLFESGAIELAEGARTSLVEVVDLLQTEPGKKIRIEGHTDQSGTAEANLEISQKRAEAVMGSLVELGVSSDRMLAVGMGEDYPIDSNETEAGRASNRRVDVILLDDTVDQ